MSRAIMKAMIEADQDRADAMFEQLPAEQQAAILERGAVVVAVLATEERLSAIAALDDDDPFAPPAKPKRTRPHKTYTFRRWPGDWNTYIVIGVRGETSGFSSLTPHSYDRFVGLANSGDYAVEIMDSDYGIAWTLRRKPA